MLSSNEGKVSALTVRQWKQFLKITARRLPRLDSLGDSHVSARKRKSIFLLINDSLRIKDLVGNGACAETSRPDRTLDRSSCSRGKRQQVTGVWPLPEPALVHLSTSIGYNDRDEMSNYDHPDLPCMRSWQSVHGVGQQELEHLKRGRNRWLSRMSYELLRLWVGSGANRRWKR